MSELLFDRLRRLRQRVRQLLTLYGLSWVVVVVLAATLAVGIADWLIHLDDPGLRLLLSLGILAAGSWTAWRYLVSPLRRSFSDVDLALRIEKRFPGFSDSLSSTVQFLRDENAGGIVDPQLGSPALQRKVIAETLSRVERIDLSDLLETRSVVRASCAAFGVCLLAATIVGSNLEAATIAIHRLVFPFSAGDWPRQTELRFITGTLEPLESEPDEPLRVAEGTTLELYVENSRGSLPEDLSLETSLADKPVVVERLRRATLRDERGQSHEVGAITLPAIRGAMRFRARGGDDDRMPFLQLEVVPPPQVTALQVTLIPPAYVGRPAETLPPGAGDLQGLVGTTVRVQAVVNKPLRSALLRLKDQPAAPMSLSPDGRSFQTEFRLAEAGAYSYWFDLKDRQGFEHPETPRYEIRATADLVPDVTIDQPATDLNVTADAEVPFRLLVRDDLGLKSVRLTARTGDGPEAPTQSVLLYEEPERPQQLALTHTLSLSEFRLSPGSRLVVHGEATDACDIGAEHLGRSIGRVLTIVSGEEKTFELAARQSALVDELERIVQAQQRSRDQVGQLLLQVEKTGSLPDADVDLLKRVELDQKQSTSRLAGPVDSIESRATGLMQELRQNHLQDESMQRRLEQLVEGLSALRRDSLPVIEQELTAARKLSDQRPPAPAETNEKSPGQQSPAQKSGDQKPGDQKTGEGKPQPVKPGLEEAREPNEVRETLRRAGEQQDLVIDTLTEELNRLAEWRSRRDVSSDLNELISAQRQLNQETAEVGRSTLGKPAEELAPQEQADLARLADRQSKLSARTGQFRSKLADLARDLEETNPDAADSLREIQEELQRAASAEKMQEAADRIEQNNIGQATAGQQELLREMDELRKSLKEKRPSDQESLIKRLKNEESELETLQKRQEELNQEFQEAAGLENPEERAPRLESLRKEQAQLKKDVDQMVRRLRKLEASNAEQAARRAAENIERADRAAENEDFEGMKEELRETLDDLEQARRDLAAERKEAEEQLAREMLEKIADEIVAVAERQKAVLAETQRLEAERQERGNWSRGQLKTLVGLAETQSALQGETSRLADRIQAAEVFALALRGAARSMQTAAARLSQRQADAVTQQAEAAALKRFQDLLDALKEISSSKPDQPQQPGEKPPENGPNQEGPPTDGIPHLAQLKMLQKMQQDLLARTEALDARRTENGTLTPEEQAELDAAALEQGQLADLARNLVAKVRPAIRPDDQKTNEPPKRDGP